MGFYSATLALNGRSSRRKGSRGELEVAGVFQAHGFDARRTPNSGGLAWRGDVQGVPGYVLEVKRCERLSLPAWLNQAYAAASGGEVPVVIFRRSWRGTARDGSVAGVWHAVVPLEELARLISADQTVCDCRRAGGETMCDCHQGPEKDESPAATGLPGCGR